jgi:hypothetical protein
MITTNGRSAIVSCLQKAEVVEAAFFECGGALIILYCTVMTLVIAHQDQRI